MHFFCKNNGVLFYVENVLSINYEKKIINYDEKMCGKINAFYFCFRSICIPSALFSDNKTSLDMFRICKRYEKARYNLSKNMRVRSW